MIVAAFRSKIRKNALGTIPADERIKAILKECDIARNQTFPKVLHHKLEVLLMRCSYF